MNAIELKTDAAMMEVSLSPTDIIANCQEQATALMEVVEAQNLFQLIKGRKFLNVEGWQLLGSFMGLTAVCQPSKCITKDGLEGWEAYVEIRDKTGAVVAGADAQCCRDERNWKSKDDFQLRSMAQTRAISKAYRTKISFIARMAGYESTPAEEINGDEFREIKAPAATPSPKPQAKTVAGTPEVAEPKVEPTARNGISVSDFTTYRDTCLQYVDEKILNMLASNLKLDGKKIGDMTKKDLDDLLAAAQHFAELEKKRTAQNSGRYVNGFPISASTVEEEAKAEADKDASGFPFREEVEAEEKEEAERMERFPIGEEETADVEPKDTEAVAG